jgi:hypothetical protein
MTTEKCDNINRCRLPLEIDFLTKERDLLKEELAVAKKAVVLACESRAWASSATCLILLDLECPFGNVFCNRKGSQIGECWQARFIQKAKETP